MDFGMKVLVVDDTALMRHILKNVLKEIGFTNIIGADDGTTALEVLKKEKIDVIFADLNMPKMSGLELLKAVRRDATLGGTPFLMVTSETQSAFVTEAIQAGVTHYIVKPFAADGIREKLNQALQK